MNYYHHHTRATLYRPPYKLCSSHTKKFALINDGDDNDHNTTSFADSFRQTATNNTD